MKYEYVLRIMNDMVDLQQPVLYKNKENKARVHGVATSTDATASPRSCYTTQ